MARNEKWMPSCTRLMLSQETTSVSFLYTCPDCTTHRHPLELLNWKKMGMRVVYIRTQNCFRVSCSRLCLIISYLTLISDVILSKWLAAARHSLNSPSLKYLLTGEGTGQPVDAEVFVTN
jgi:hypothetical protein